ncbi:MAG: hypothetical protein DRJ42_07640 [Deltaproteobacteria bacterium]|nr:MAG: hypothetical protein DRJ42_07640 [Deltaproteobacteria bacterium]
MVPILLDVHDGESGREMLEVRAVAENGGDESTSRPCADYGGSLECTAAIERLPGNVDAMAEPIGWRRGASVRVVVEVSASGYDPVSFPVEFTADDCGGLGSQRWTVVLNESGNELGRAELAETTEPCR